ncbi:MAG: SusC/RagA family TonB-linked outer membrane protein [Flavobacteriaceae bacterium]|jgi:TonB-linked SusC/RagA family outer membrane protein
MTKMRNSFLFTVVACLSVLLTFAQQTVTGKVLDADGNPLPGANVVIEGTSKGTTTDFDGNYQISVQDGETLIFSFIGFDNQQLVVGQAGSYDVQLSLGNQLSEVIVSALGSVKENRALGYSIQTVEGENVDNAKETNIINALQGQVAGVQIQGSASSLGGSSRITIRGSNSFLGNNQPLFVIDGVPVDNRNFASNSQQSGFGGGAYDYGNMASDIDPSTVKSMSVLKGAAATALYGSRGANGVILITTKDGSGGKKGIGISINSSVTFDDVQNLIPMQQMYGGGSIDSNYAHGFSELIQDGVTYLYPNYKKDGAWGPRYDPNVLVRHWDSWDPTSPNYKETRPWVAPENGFEEFFETGVTFNNTISFEGANEKGSFRLGYTNLDQTGTLPQSKLERNSINLNSNYNLTDKLKAGIAINYVNTAANGRNATGYNNNNPLQAFNQWWQTQLDVERLKNNQDNGLGQQYTWNPVGPIVNPDTKELIRWNANPNYFDNPYWVRNNYLQEDGRNRLFGNANLSYQITEELSVSTQFSTDWYQFSIREGIPLRSVDLSSYSETERKFQETNMDVRLNYIKDISDDLNLTAFVGGNAMKQLTKRTSIGTNGGIIVDKFFNIANSADDPSTSTYESNRGINSVYGSASLGFKELVYLDVAVRNDWSSTLPVENNSYFYPSTSLSFVFSEVLDANFLNFGKVRVSRAQAGNDANPYSLTDVFLPVPPNFGSNPLYAVPGSKNNPNLKNELTTEIEFGFDLRLFDNRLFIDGAYYDRSTVDQIFSVASSDATGYSSSILNAGEMRNWGWEFQVTATPIQTNDFTWTLGVNYTLLNNEVVELYDGVENIAVGSTWAANTRIAKGYPYMSLWGQDYTYINGRPVVGANGMYVPTDSRVYLGSAIADAVGGFSTSFDYKNFNLSALFDFQQGGIMHSTSLQWSKYSGMHPETVSFNGESDTRANGMVLPGVTESGAENTTRVDPQAYYQTMWRFAAPNTYEASFLKFRELRLSYTLPKSISNSLSVENMDISFFGRNIAILSADIPYIDPQIVTGSGNNQGLENAQVPSTRSLGVNLRATF